MQTIHKKVLASALSIVSFAMYALAFAVHESWPHPAVAWLTGTFFYALGGMTIYNYLFGSHKGHPVYMRMLFIYLALAIVFLIRSYGLLLGPAYWGIGASIVFILWLVVRPYQMKIKQEKTLGISQDYFGSEKDSFEV